MEDVKESIGSLLKDENVQIDYDFSKADKLLTFKPYLYSIFYNLITNSIKFRRRSIRTIIKIQSSESNGSLNLIFKDNGLGIDLKKSHTEVFGLYKRFQPSIEVKGMGLFMVKTQVESLGGKIDIKSKIDKGTEFIIEFKNFNRC